MLEKRQVCTAGCKQCRNERWRGSSRGKKSRLCRCQESNASVAAAVSDPKKNYSNNHTGRPEKTADQKTRQGQRRGSSNMIGNGKGKARDINKRNSSNKPLTDRTEATKRANSSTRTLLAALAVVLYCSGGSCCSCNTTAFSLCKRFRRISDMEAWKHTHTRPATSQDG